MYQLRFKHQSFIDKIIAAGGGRNLSKNSNALDYLEQNPSIINWDLLCENKNPLAIKLIEENLDRLTTNGWNNLCGNINAVHIIEQNLDKINNISFINLCSNPNAIPLIEANLSKLNDECWLYLCSNMNAIELIEINLDHFDAHYWSYICSNSNAIELLEMNLDKLNRKCWVYLCMNTNPDVIKIIENNLDKLNDDCWWNLSCNMNAIRLLEMNKDKINLFALSKNQNGLHLFEKDLILDDWAYMEFNPSLFDIDYIEMSKERSDIIYQELISKALKGSRVSTWLDYFIEQGNGIEDFDWITTN
jgi:hypothetical protein